MTNSPRTAWLRFGAELRRLRELSGRTQSDLGRSSLLSKATVSAFERGTRIPKRERAERLDTMLSTGGALTRLWEEVATQREIPEWWRSALALEQRSQEILDYEPTIIPGLLQTADYAREVFRTGRPRAAPDQIETAVQRRTERMPRLREIGLPLLCFIVSETALRRFVGTKSLMADQLESVARLAEERAIRFHILPDDSTPPGANLPFRINVLRDTQSVVHVEHALGGVTQADPEALANLTTLFRELTAESLSTRASLEWIHQERETWSGIPVATAEPPGATA